MENSQQRVWKIIVKNVEKVIQKGIIPLSNADAYGVEMVGGKAFNLGILSNYVNVKPGIVIPVSVIQSGTLPSFPSDKNKKYAVRSSAVAEDGNEHSWSGQFDTVLNVPGSKILQSIHCVSKGTESDRVKNYQKATQSNHGGLAIIVQEMVRASVSGVLFTQEPLSGEDVIVIELHHGIAEKLVSGTIKPYRYYVSKKTSQVIFSEGESKARLNNSQIKELVTTGEKIEFIFGKSQDIEWAYEKGTSVLYTNQSRSITGLNKSLYHSRIGFTTQLHDSGNDEATRLTALGLHTTKNVYSDQNIAELITPHPSQMAYGLFTYIFAHGDGAIKTARNQMGYDLGEEMETGFFNLIGGQPRCSIIHDALTYRIRGFPLADYYKMINYYLEEIGKDANLANYPEVVLYSQRPSKGFLINLYGKRKGPRLYEKYQEHHAEILQVENNIKFRVDIFLKEWKTIIEELQNRLQSINKLSIDELVTFYTETCDLLRTKACVVFVMAARIGFYGYTRLRNNLIAHYGKAVGEQYANELTSGLDWSLNPNVVFQNELYQFNKGLVKLEDIISKFGHLSSHELEIDDKTYAERPEVLHAISSKLHDSPKELNDKLFAHATGLKSKINTDKINYPELEHDFHIARTGLGLRELVKFEYLKGYQILRKISLRINHLLRWEENTIFGLEPTDIFNLSLENKNSICKLATSNQEKRVWAKENLFVPQVLYSKRLDELNYSSVEVNYGSSLKGLGVTSFSCEGEVVVIQSVADLEAIKKLASGKILVTTTTDPAWSPFLAAVCPNGGLITEIGGLLAHGANYAREMKIAAVLNVPNATKILKTGMIVRVDGMKGIVAIKNCNEKKILFICHGNVARSQIAEAYFNHFTNSLNATSAGCDPTTPSRWPKIAPEVIEVMEEEKIDVSTKKVKYVEEEMLNGIDKVIVLCNKECCPNFILNHHDVLFWDIEDPYGSSIENFRKIRDKIKPFVSNIL